MGDFMCKAVCWVLAAGIAVIAAIVINSLIAPGTILLLLMAIIIFLVLAFVLPPIICGKSESSGEAKASYPQSGDAQAEPKAEAAPAAPAPAPAAAATAAPAAASAGASWTDTVGPSGQAGPNRGATGIKPSVELTEEATVRDSVGSWRYESGASAYKAPAGAATAAPAAPSTPVEGDYDGDGVVEGKDEGEKPATLTEARGGKADDLKQIKGVGPKMEGLLNSLGFFHFDQVAGWTDQEVAWVDANLEGFKGRVSRDNWVEQAKVLAAGGETEFSKRVEDGGVY